MIIFVIFLRERRKGQVVTRLILLSDRKLCLTNWNFSTSLQLGRNWMRRRMETTWRRWANEAGKFSPLDE